MQDETQLPAQRDPALDDDLIQKYRRVLDEAYEEKAVQDELEELIRRESWDRE